MSHQPILSEAKTFVLYFTWQDCVKDGWEWGFFLPPRIKDKIHIPNWQWISEFYHVWQLAHNIYNCSSICPTTFKFKISFSQFCQRIFGSVYWVSASLQTFQCDRNIMLWVKALGRHHNMREEPLFIKKVERWCPVVLFVWLMSCADFQWAHNE